VLWGKTTQQSNSSQERGGMVWRGVRRAALRGSGDDEVMLLRHLGVRVEINMNL